MATFKFTHITGQRELDKKLRELDTKAKKKIVRSAVTKGLRFFVKAAKQIVPPKYKSVKRLLNYRFAKDKRRNEFVAKWGVAVGKRKAVTDKDATKKRRGVGLTAENVHWIFIGTGERRHKSGHPTGRMPAILKDIIPRTMSANDDIAVGIITKGVLDGIEKWGNKK